MGLRRKGLGQLLAAVLGLALVLPAPSQAGPKKTQWVSMGICDMMVTATLDPAERLRRFLPPGYRIGANLFSAGTREVGVLMMWVFSCDGVQMLGRTTSDVRFSFSTIAIETDERETTATTTPRNFDLYAVYSHTENPAFAAWLNAHGFSMSVVDHIAIDRSDKVEYEIDHPETGFSMTAYPLHPDVVGRVHDHNNTFWYLGDDGRVGVFRLQIHHATDTACYLLVPCGELQATPGTPSGALNGGATRPIHMVFDHVGLSEVTANVTTRES